MSSTIAPVLFAVAAVSAIILIIGLVVFHLVKQDATTYDNYANCLADHARLIDRSLTIIDGDPAYQQFSTGSTHPSDTHAALTALALFAPPACGPVNFSGDIERSPHALAECTHTHLQTWHRHYQVNDPTTDAMLFARTRYVATICNPAKE